MRIPTMIGVITIVEGYRIAGGIDIALGAPVVIIGSLKAKGSREFGGIHLLHKVRSGKVSAIEFHKKLLIIEVGELASTLVLKTGDVGVGIYQFGPKFGD